MSHFFKIPVLFSRKSEKKLPCECTYEWGRHTHLAFAIGKVSLQLKSYLTAV